jgi:hypothetical protein
MENWFIASLNVLVAGLSIKVIARTLSLTTESPKDVIPQLTKLGFNILYAGIAIIVIGIIMWILTPGPQAGIGITSVGLAVILLGGGTILRARGHRHEKTVQIGARVLIGIGAGAFLVGLIAYFISPLLGA